MVLKNRLKNSKGFTFVEIVVVLGIFAAISSVVLFNFRDFSSGVSLQNLSQQIALQVSNMQRNALAGGQPISIQIIPTGSGGSRWTSAYGICFTDSASGCYMQSQYGSDGEAFVLYADDLNNNVFTSNQERIDVIQIEGGDRVYELCLNEQTGIGVSCTDEVHVTYTRPEATPEIRYGSGFSQSASDLTVKIQSESGAASREVVIWKSGQVEVN